MFLNLGTPPHGPPPPFAAWSRKQIRTIERAVARAWATISSSPEGSRLLASGTEPQITAALQDALIALLGSGEVAGYTPAIHGWPIRGQEAEDYTGTLLEKRPDLTFPRLSARPASNHNALFYECKIIGRGRSLSDYVTHGVARFQKGFYAWAMPHAGMIGYVFDASLGHADVALPAAWSGRATPLASFAPTAAVDFETLDSSTRIATSTHTRAFKLRNGVAPGAIEIRHLWLRPS